jgi:HSP20 family protein
VTEPDTHDQEVVTTMLSFDAFTPLFEMQRTLDRLSSGSGAPATFLPPADIAVTDEAVTVVLDVPGVKAEDLDVQLQGDVLTIRGERAWPYQAVDGGVRRVERGFGRFERSLRVPAGLDAGAIGAALEDGVLRLTLPKPEQQRPHRIAVEVGGGETRQLATASG